MDLGLPVLVIGALTGGPEADEGAGGAADAAVDVDVVVIVLELAAGGAVEAFRCVVAGKGVAFARDTDGHGWEIRQKMGLRF